MNIIGHRGASVEEQENTLESLRLGAKLGAFAVECDIRITADNKYVIFHDENLVRLAGDSRNVDEITYSDMKQVLASNGKKLYTLDEILNNYDGKCPILFDLGNNKGETLFWKPFPELFEKLSKSRQEIIIGIHSLEEAKEALKYFDDEHILAFMEDQNKYKDYYDVGIRIIRLWEQWLSEVNPKDVKKVCSDAKVWIMAYTKENGNNGNPDSVQKVKAMGADAMLLNDVRMGLKNV